jgi:hypothetical protein
VNSRTCRDAPPDLNRSGIQRNTVEVECATRNELTRSVEGWIPFWRLSRVRQAAVLGLNHQAEIGTEQLSRRDFVIACMVEQDAS